MRRFISLLLVALLAFANVNVGAKAEGTDPLWGAKKIGALSFAEKLASSDSSKNEVVVAVIDSGIDASIPKFDGRLILKEDMNLTDEKEVKSASGEFHHGTFVSSVIVDCTPNLNNIKIMPVKASYNGDGDDDIATWAKGVDYAVEHGAQIINMSLGGHEEVAEGDEVKKYEALRAAVKRAVAAGVTVVVAASNEGSSTSAQSPANIREAITVAAVDESNTLAEFSNFGANVDFSAPGVDIAGALPGGVVSFENGTSFATPHITALCAMIKMAHPDYSPQMIEKVLMSNCADLESKGWDYYTGYGIPDFSNVIPGQEKSDYDNTADLVKIEDCFNREAFEEDIETVKIDGYQCTDADDGIAIVGVGYDYVVNPDVEIPATLEYEGETYPVKSVSIYNYKADMSTVKSIKVASSVATIDDWAFKGCVNVTSVELSEGLKSIGDLAFASDKLKEITIPDSVTEMADRAVGFVDGDNYDVDYVSDFVVRGNVGTEAQQYAIRSGVTFVPLDGSTIGTVFRSGDFTYRITGKNTVELAKSIKINKKQTIPATVKYGTTYKVTSIADRAFYANEYITTVTIGKNIKKIGAGAFWDSIKLKKIVVKSTGLKKSKVGKNAFKNVAKKAKFTFPKSKKKAYKKFLKRS